VSCRRGKDFTFEESSKPLHLRFAGESPYPGKCFRENELVLTPASKGRFP
jgi:hypothetical protein